MDPADYDIVVMDAEPLVAYFLDDADAGLVEAFLLAVEEGTVEGCIHDVTRSEVYYVCSREGDERTAEEYVESLVLNGFAAPDADDHWRTVGDVKRTHATALGDAVAIATAWRRQATSDGDVLLLVGGDDDFEPFVGTGRTAEPDVVRFRDGSD